MCMCDSLWLGSHPSTRERLAPTLAAVSLTEDFFTEREAIPPSQDELLDAVRNNSVPELLSSAFGKKNGKLPGQPKDELRFFYRGQVDHRWGISSSLYRSVDLPQSQVTEDRLRTAEDRVLAAMRAQGLGYRTTDGELLMLLQHHGIPTRLVDVSTTPQPALHFAAEKDDSVDGRLFVIALRVTNGEVPLVKLSGDATPVPWSRAAKGNKYATSAWTRTVALVDEDPLDPRMRAQDGRFLVGGLMRRYSGETLRCNSDEVAAEAWSGLSTLKIFFPQRKATRSAAQRWPAVGWSLRIRADWKPALREALAVEGLTSDHIYPDFEGCRRLGQVTARQTDPV